MKIDRDQKHFNENASASENPSEQNNKKHTFGLKVFKVKSTFCYWTVGTTPKFQLRVTTFARGTNYSRLTYSTHVVIGVSMSHRDQSP